MALVKVRHGDWQMQKVTPPPSSSTTQLTYGHVYVRLSICLSCQSIGYARNLVMNFLVAVSFERQRNTSVIMP